MTKQDLLSSLEKLRTSLGKLRTNLNRNISPNVSKVKIRGFATELGNIWFEEISNSLTVYHVDEKIKERFDALFTRLLELGQKVSKKSSYLRVTKEILDGFSDELMVNVMKSAGSINTRADIVKILESATEDERSYLDEAIKCSDADCFKASVVLGWSAAMYRVHKIVEVKYGFDELNRNISDTRNAGGRYKRLRDYDVHSLNDIQRVPDNDLLMVLEHWNIIDNNEYDRLNHCFTLRNNSAHPGKAIISPENIASFYSDIKSMIFDNSKFSFQQN